MLERAPGQPDVLHLIAGIRGRLGDHAGAVHAIRQALRGRPDDAAFCCSLGIQLAAVGHLDAAIEALQRACSLQPALATAWYNLGVLQVRAVRFEDAEAALRKSLDLAPDNLQARVQLADLLKMAGRADAAAPSWREVLKAHPGRGDAWWGLADLKQAGLGDDDIPAMQAAIRDPHASERDRIAFGFAIARVLELPGNWMHVGAIRAMLPAAKVIVCWRDPLETCFSCCRQYMTADGQGWTHRFEDLAAYRNAFDRALQQWQSHHSGFVYSQDYENLLAAPEASVRALLAFCGLPFEDACLAFGSGSRAVRSPSAAQVREPLRRDTARATRHGALLDPLRNALGIVDIQSAH